MKRGAFSLIELLCVLGVLEVLAAILLPVFATAREAGRGAMCRGNLCQLARAFAIYAQDFDGCYPAGGDVGSISPAGWVIAPTPYLVRIEAGSLYPYVRSVGIYRCPADDAGRRLSYVMNSLVALQSEASFDHPAGTLLLVEEGAGPRNDGIWLPTGPLDHLTDRHAGWANVSFLDGHVAGFRPERGERSPGQAPPEFQVR